MTRSEARELRLQVRSWRRGRADARLVDVLGDAYVALFATVMLGSIAVNVVLGIGRLSDERCAAGACAGSRALLPVLVAVAFVAGVVLVARMLGPVFVSPAVGSWLMPTPVDRRDLLRPRLLVGLVVAALLGAVVTAAGAVLGGWSPAGATALTGAVALGSAGLVAVGVRAQSLPASSRGARWVGVAAWLPGVLVWGGLLAVALDLTTGVHPPEPDAHVVWLVLGVAAAGAFAATAYGLRSLPRLARRDVSRGGALAPGLSGALSSLDLALAYDVVLEHRWRGHLPVRSRRARRGPRTGAAALVRADLTRVRRSPRLLVLPVAAAVVPYAAEAAGAGLVVLLLAPLAGFLAGLPLLIGLRVVERTPSLSRLLPFPSAYAKGAATVVPGAVLLLLGLLCAPVLDTATGAPPGAAVLLGLAVGASSTASAVRWVTGRPPDYGRPMVSTPAGGVPTNLYGSVVRGFDVLVLTTAPLLLLDDPVLAAEISLLISAVVVAALLGRPDKSQAS
ncbi:DUF6297 family protein [Nocardioides plantarum]|uniref:DUF6297 family protein n=1 Tax=Nocardioides plantarum TaxID=29299 RepID=A0ABV5KCD9_9ACTN|nr:DUF6297 family protein [Nocardioides plantarum]